MFEVPSMFRPPSMFGPPSMFTGVAQAATGVESTWCLSFDGTNDYVNCGSGSVFNFGSSNFTVACWFRTTDKSISGSSYRSIASWGVYTSTRLTIKIRSDTGALETWWSTGARTTSTATGLDDGNWHHMAYVRSGTTFSFYIDGALSGSSTHSVTFGFDALMLGVGGVGPQVADGFWHGQLDHFGVYSRAISSTEVTAIYTNTSPPTDVAAYLDLEEGTGTSTAVKDSTGSTIATATLTNGPVWHPQTPPKLVSGRVTSARSLLFDGVNDYLELSSGVALTGEFSLLFWMKTSVSGGIAGWRTLVGFSSPGDGLFIQSLATYLYLESVTTGSKSFTDTTAVTDSNWHHVCVTRDASNVIRIYVDGVVSSNTPTRTGTITVQRFAGRAAGEAFGGRQDDPRIFSRALTAADIQKLCRGQNPTTNDPVGWWKLDETSGTTAVDLGSGGHDGTLVNGPTRSTDVSQWLSV